MSIVYSVGIFFATFAGALLGLGGGIIIKPFMEAVSPFTLGTIHTLSGITVLAMAIVSTVKFLKSGFKVTKQLCFLSLGAVFGGITGKYLFNLFVGALPGNTPHIIQSVMLIVICVVILFKNRMKSYKLNGLALITLSGAIMGVVSAFLGIGGGPVNILVLYVLFALDIKEASAYSIFIILCSQAASFVMTMTGPEIYNIDFTPLFYMIPAAVAGSYIGAAVNHKSDNARLDKYFTILMVGLVFLNLYNIYKYTL